MGYVLKEDVAVELRAKFKNGYIAQTLGVTPTYVSLILHRKRVIPKYMAYSFTKVIGSELEIEDLFERV